MKVKADMHRTPPSRSLSGPLSAPASAPRLPVVDDHSLAKRLLHVGMAPKEAENKGQLFAAALHHLPGGHGASDDLFFLFVPGRIEVLGKHTDYAGGRSLLATVERGFCFVARRRNDNIINVVEAGDATDGGVVSLEFGPELTPKLGHWSNYPATVARRVARNFAGPLAGADIAIISDLPPAAGMSSSSALMSGMFMVLAHINGLQQRDDYLKNITSAPTLAGYLATIENGQNFGPFIGDRGVGTFGGSEDHTAICCCEPGKLHVFAFCPVRQEKVIDFPKDYLFAVASSGVLAEKTGEAMAKYNKVSQLVAALLELWNQATGRGDRCLADAIHSSSDATEQLEKIVADHPHEKFGAHSLNLRLRQFIEENERIIPAAIVALGQGNIEEFGRLVDKSQEYSETMLQNQVPQTVHLAHSARTSPCGAVAASAFGAGFGGSVWAMVHRDRADEFLTAWEASYKAAFPGDAGRARFFLTHPGPSMTVL